MFNKYDVTAYNPEAALPEHPIPPEGPYRVRVEEAERMTGKNSGKEMVRLKLAVSGYGDLIYHYIVDNQYAQRNLDQFFDSFGITPGNFNLDEWVWTAGAAMLKHENYEGRTRAKVAYFILRSRQDALPEWNKTADDGAGAEPRALSLRDEIELPF